jgi:chromosome segregation ATPase
MTDLYNSRTVLFKKKEVEREQLEQELKTLKAKYSENLQKITLLESENSNFKKEIETMNQRLLESAKHRESTAQIEQPQMEQELITEREKNEALTKKVNDLAQNLVCLLFNCLILCLNSKRFQLH